jgi:hypothetical protein
MTAAPVTTRKKKSGTLAALDRRGGAWRLVIDRRARGSGFETSTLSDADLATLGDKLAKAGVTRLIRVAPACESLAKIDATPDAAGDELVAALGLLGEAGLPEDVPSHRRAAGFVGSPARVLVTGWMRREAVSPRLALSGIEESWITEPAAVLAIANGEGFELVSWDRELGSILAVKTVGEKPLVRCIRADGTDADAWARSLASAARSVGLEGTSSFAAPRGIATDTATLGAANVSDSMASSEFGPAVGALIVGSGEETAAPLAMLRSGTDSARESAVIRTARWVSVPRRAVIVGAACLAVCALAPMAMAWVRLQVVTSKLDAVQGNGAKESRERLTKDAAMYRQLEQSRWPMTKLMADVSNATPVGVVMESLTLEREGSQAVVMKGRADSPEVLALLQKNLVQTGVMADVKLSAEADGSGVTFSLQAKVISPRSASRLVDDFGKKTLQDRIYDGGSTPVAGAVPADAAKPDPMAAEAEDEESARPSDTGRAGTNGGGNGGSRNGNGGSRAGESATAGETNKALKPLDVPPPLTDEQIAAMDKSTATKEWAARRAAFQRASTSPEDKARLEAEVKKLEPKWKGGGS